MSTQSVAIARYLNLACQVLRGNGHWSNGNLMVLSLGERAEVVEWAIAASRGDKDNLSLSERMKRHGQRDKGHHG